MNYIYAKQKVMFTAKLITKFSPYIRSVCIVKDSLYLNGRNSSSGLPDIVMVEFVKYSCPPLLKSRPKVAAIIPVEKKMIATAHAKEKRSPYVLGGEQQSTQVPWHDNLGRRW